MCACLTDSISTKLFLWSFWRPFDAIVVRNNWVWVVSCIVFWRNIMVSIFFFLKSHALIFPTVNWVLCSVPVKAAWTDLQAGVYKNPLLLCCQSMLQSHCRGNICWSYIRPDLQTLLPATTSCDMSADSGLTMNITSRCFSAKKLASTPLVTVSWPRSAQEPLDWHVVSFHGFVASYQASLKFCPTAKLGILSTGQNYL